MLSRLSVVAIALSASLASSANAFGCHPDFALDKANKRSVAIKVICPSSENGNRFEYWSYNKEPAPARYAKLIILFNNGPPFKAVFGISMPSDIGGRWEFGPLTYIKPGDGDVFYKMGEVIRSCVCDADDATKAINLRRLSANWQKYTPQEK